MVFFGSLSKLRLSLLCRSLGANLLGRRLVGLFALIPSIGWLLVAVMLALGLLLLLLRVACLPVSMRILWSGPAWVIFALNFKLLSLIGLLLFSLGFRLRLLHRRMVRGRLGLSLNDVTRGVLLRVGASALVLRVYWVLVLRDIISDFASVAIIFALLLMTRL